MGNRIWLPGGGGGADTDVVTAEAGDVVKGKVIVDKDGNPLTGTLELTGTAIASHVLDGEFFYAKDPKVKQEGTMPDRRKIDPTIGAINSSNPKVSLYKGLYPQSGQPTNQSVKWFAMGPPEGYYWAGNSYVGLPWSELASAIGLTAAKLANGQTVLDKTGTYKGLGNAVQANVIKGKTFSTASLSNATGTLAVQSAINFSAAARSGSKVRISWKNPSKGPYQGVTIRMSTSGYPGTSGGTVKYSGTGSSTTASATSYVDITGLTPGTTYYFTCVSWVTNLGYGTSYNVSVKTVDYVKSAIWFDNPTGIRASDWIAVALDENKILGVCAYSNKIYAQVITVQNGNVTKGSQYSYTNPNVASNYGIALQAIKISSTKAVCLCGTIDRNPAHVFALSVTISGTAVSFSLGNSVNIISPSGRWDMTAYHPKSIGTVEIKGNNDSGYTVEGTCSIDSSGNVTFNGDWSKHGDYNYMPSSEAWDARTVRGGGTHGYDSGVSKTLYFTSSGGMVTLDSSALRVTSGTFYNGSGYVYNNKIVYYVNGDVATKTNLTLSANTTNVLIAMNNSKNKLLIVHADTFYSSSSSRTIYFSTYSISENTKLSLIKESSITATLSYDLVAGYGDYAILYDRNKSNHKLISF